MKSEKLATRPTDDRYEDYLVEAFANEAKRDTDKLAAISLAVGGLLWTFTGNAIAGLAAGGFIMLYSDRAVRESNRALEAIEKTRLAAPFLHGDSFQEFRRQYGDALVLDQLREAHEYQLPLHSEPEDYLFDNYPELENPAPIKRTQPIAANTTAPDPSRLLDRLRSECPELLKLVKSPPIRLVGHQRTGKSSLARKLALLRAILLPGHAIWWATPHGEQDNPVPDELNPVGFSADGKDFASIERMWKATQMGLDRGNQLNQTTVWDEFGRYGVFQEKELLSEGIRSVLEEATKHGYYPILIAHGDQAKWFPGVAGLFATLKQGTVKVESIGEPANDFGEMKPTGRYRVTDLDGNTSEFSVPSWLTEDYLLGIVRSRRSQSPAPVSTQPEPPTESQATAPPSPTRLYQAGESDRETLGKMFSLPAEFAEIPSQAKTDSVAPESPLNEVESYVRARGECPESAVKNWGKNRRKGALNASEVEELLIELISLGKLESFTPPSGKGRWLRWTATG